MSFRTVNIEYIRTPIYRASGGQMQLVLMARVLAQEPEILLLDEPTSHLDVGNQIRVIDMVSGLAERGLSIVMTSHFPDHAFLASNRVGIMKDKTFIAMGDADEVVTEQNLKATYGVDIRIVYMGGDINRKIAVPLAGNGRNAIAPVPTADRIGQ
jgi:iron complex transport system ATP-binding protein